ncbi:MAG: helix-turn-helix domain-containing protein [Clostridia bacterium]
MLLGDIILNYRNSFNPKISQRDFAKKCGLSHTYIAALEKNIDPRTGKPIAPTLDTVKFVAKAMNIHIEDLLKMLDNEQEFKLNEDAPKYEEPLYFMTPVYRSH